MEKGESVIIIPLDENKNVIFIREYFTTINQTQVALPKGRIDPEQTPEQAAQKKLQEEIGYKANKLKFLTKVTATPGYNSQITHILLALDLTESKLNTGDELEILEQFRHPLSEFQSLINSEDLTEARIITALFLATIKFKEPIYDHAP